MPSAFSWLMLVPSSLRLPAPVNQGVRLSSNSRHNRWLGNQPATHMNTEALCNLILGEIDESTLPFYRDVLLNEPVSAIKDPLWLAAATLARTLSTTEQEVILALMRQAAIDASSTLLGAIDGNTSLNEQFVELSLTDADGVQHSGELQDEFLRQAEGT